MENLHDILLESNRIEGIQTVEWPERKAAVDFLALDRLSIPAIESYLSIVQSGAVLRNKVGLDVMVGKYHPPRGGSHIRRILHSLLEQINDGEVNAFQAHIRYEKLHPFTDGNGRSGRMIWLWQMKSAPLGFLHTFYYQALRG